MSLLVLQWGGSLMDSAPGGSPIEIWSNSLAIIGPASPDPASYVTAMGGLVGNYFTDARTGIAPTVKLEWYKINEFSPTAPFHQITDPTVGYNYAINVRGGTTDLTTPLSMAYRVSIDDGTRNPRARGGWFVPRPGVIIQDNGRLPAASITDHVTTALAFIEGINAISGLKVGVWSRKSGSVTAVSRLRIGDVPDNISRRRNALREAYQVHAIV